MAQILFVICFLGGWLGCVFLPKTNKMNAISAIMLGYMSTLCYGAVGILVLSLFKLDITLISGAIIYAILAGFTWGYIFKKREIQCLEWRKCDLWGTIWGAVLVGGISVYIFEIYLHLNYYNTVDPSSHYRFAMEVIRNKKVSGMYFTQFHNAMFMELLLPLIPEAWSYKAFILADCFHTLMQYYVFYGFMLYLFRKNSGKYAPIILSLLYWLGYPLYSFADGGYVYWAMGGTIVIYIMWLLMIYEEYVSLRKWCIIGLGIGCFSLVVCYVQFFPAAILMVACVFVFEKYKDSKIVLENWINKKRLVQIGSVAIGLGICAVVGYYWIFYRQGVSLFEALSLGTNTSRNLEIIVSAPIIYYIIQKCIRNKKINAVIWGTLAFYLVHFCFVVLASLNLVSSYYLFKNHYVLWFLIFAVLVEFWNEMDANEKRYMQHYIWGISICLLLMYTPKDEFLTDESLSLDNSIYRYNAVLFQKESFRESYVESKMNLIEYVAENYKDETVSLVGTHIIKGTCYWYYTIAEQTCYYDTPMTVEKMKDYVSEIDFPYIMMFYDSDAYKATKEYMDTFEKVYETDEGFIAKVK